MLKVDKTGEDAGPGDLPILYLSEPESRRKRGLKILGDSVSEEGPDFRRLIDCWTPSDVLATERRCSLVLATSKRGTILRGRKHESDGEFGLLVQGINYPRL